MPTILLAAEDELRDVLRIGLETRLFDVEEASTTADAPTLADACRADAIVLDGDMEDGIHAARPIRAARNAPIILLTGIPVSRRALADAGCDEAVLKPFHLSELADRIRAALAVYAEPVAANSNSDSIPFGVAELRPSLRAAVISGGAYVELPDAEFLALAALAAHPGRVLSHAEIALAASPCGPWPSASEVDALMASASSRLDALGAASSIRAVASAGYAFRCPAVS